MKVVSIRECKALLSSYVDRSQKQRVLITRHGKPVSLMVGVQGYDIEDLLTASDPEFWKMIEARRKNSHPIRAGRRQALLR